jgi:hypothetical protein
MAAALGQACASGDAGCRSTWYASTTSRSATSKTLTLAPEDHDGPPSPPTSTLAPSAAQASPARVLARYGQLYVNWSWQTVAGKERRLAALSVGQAHAQALAAAAQPEQTLPRYAVHNQGQVVAIAAGRGIERGRGLSSPTKRPRATAHTRDYQQQATSPGQRSSEPARAGLSRAGILGADRG